MERGLDLGRCGGGDALLEVGVPGEVASEVRCCARSAAGSPSEGRATLRASSSPRFGTGCLSFCIRSVEVEGDAGGALGDPIIDLGGDPEGRTTEFPWGGECAPGNIPIDGVDPQSHAGHDFLQSQELRLGG
jgi:hypothetical protein